MKEQKEISINKIKEIESELTSFEEQKKESDEILKYEKKRFINEIKSGSFDEMLSEIENREKNKKKETLLDKLFKLI